jgi:tripartite-type tricarboxylate transporter receptor subunit TctC
MKTLLLSAVFAASLPGFGGALAQDFPSRAVTIVAPFPAGGPADAIARVVAEPMRAFFNQTVVVENVAGAGGNIGTGRVARAAPDGYSLIIGQWSTHVVNQITYSLPYNVLTDFEPVGLLTITPQVIIVRKDFPAKDANELVAWLKANPDKANAASVGAAGGAQVSAMYFQKATGTTFRFVPYRGGHPAMVDLVAGRVDLMFDQGANALAQIRAGGIKAYAVMAKSRWHALPDVPSVEELGMPGLHVAYWHAIWAPKGTPKPVVARLNAAIQHALANANAKKRLDQLGHDVMPKAQQTPEALAAYHKAETDRWWPIVRQMGLKAK